MAPSTSAPSAFCFERNPGNRREPWAMADPSGKLALRSRLPGASLFDRSAEAIARARRAGVGAGDLLPLAFASSWLVNSAVPSPVLAEWSTPPRLGYWRTLIAQVDRPLEELAGLGDADVARIAGAVAGLSTRGQGPGALSKVLALLAPQAVPLMPDAALAFALEGAPRPPANAPDAQTAGPELFAPMLAWFARNALAHEARLRAIAADDARRRGAGDRLAPAQVFDRLLWFDSVGFRMFREKDLGKGGFFWVTAGEGASLRQAVVYVRERRDGEAQQGAPIALDAEPEGAFKSEATRALDAAAPPPGA